MRWLLLPVTVSVLLSPTIARAADQFSAKREALSIIQDTAASICSSVEQSGSSTKESISGKIGAQLPVATKRLLDLGIEGAGKLESEQYRGVVREQLADVIKHTTDCRKSVFDRLLVYLAPSPPEMQASTTQGPVSFELEHCEPALGAVQCTLVASASRAGNLMVMGYMPRDGLESQLIPDNSHIPYPASVGIDAPGQNPLVFDKIQPGIPRKVYLTVQDLPVNVASGQLTAAYTFDQQPERATFHINLLGQ